MVKIWVENRGGYSKPGSDAPAVMTPEIALAAVEEAHAHGLRTIAHVKTVSELKTLLEAGIDMWTHPISDAHADEELLDLLRSRDEIWYLPVHTPALAGGAGRRAAGERPEWLTDPLLQAIQCPGFLEAWGMAFERRPTGSSSTGGIGGENARRFLEAGVKVALGSHDAGGYRVLAWNSHLELESFVNWMGMTPHEAIIAATSAGAELLGRPDLGSVAAGKSADLVVLDADPLADIRNTRRISRVFLRGVEIDRPALAKRWSAQCPIG